VKTRYPVLVLGVAILLLAPCAPDGGARAQLPVSRVDALRAALAGGSRVALARADSALARAALITARALPNPSLAASHSGAPPQKHLVVDVPFDAPWQRGPRISAANAASRSARLRYLSERAAALLEVDTTYTTALGAHARFRLSRQTARDADSLRKMTVSRRNAGDASDLDVDLATVTAGQQENVAASDSLSYMSALLTVQTLMGIPADSIAIVLTDTLRLTPADTRTLLDATDSAVVLTRPPATTAATTAGSSATLPTSIGGTPSIAAAEANLMASELAISRERRGVFGITSFQVGVEWGDPTTDPPDSERLYLFGVTIPLPFLNQNQGAIAQATAERDRARAELASLRLETRQRIVESYRELASLRARVARDQDLVVRAERVAAKSMTAYREGASALPAVLEARRTAREVLGQYIDDLTALIILQSELRVLTGTAPQP
jgi:outer membrane protein, heavy metal efflux system